MECYTASVLTPLYDQKAEWNRRISMIHEAADFLYSSTYFIQHDRYGREYTDALAAACRRGVSVILLIDGFGQYIAGNLMTVEEKRTVKAAFAELRDQGARVVFYRCRSPLKKLLGSGMHIKIQLSDKGGALFASGNISATSYDQWQEFSVYTEGKIVARLLEEFTALGVSVEEGHRQILAAHGKNAPDTTALEYISYNPVMDSHPLNPMLLNRPNRITDYLEEEFARAESSISLTSFYFKPVPVLAKALVRAAKRGVAVEIFHSHRDALGPTIMPWLPSFDHYRPLIDAGASIYENRQGEHSKIILIDKKKAIFGSYNLEYAAHDRLAEAMMVSKDVTFLAAIENIFAGLRARDENIKVKDASIMALPRNVRRKIRLARPFSRWL